MTNIEKSEQVIAKILNSLFEKGLQKGDLQSGQLDLPADQSPFFEECVFWLLNEGIISTKNAQETLSGHLFLTDPQLTAKGFAVMHQSFSLNGKSTTVAATAIAASNDSNFFSNLGEFGGSFLGALTKSVSG